MNWKTSVDKVSVYFSVRDCLWLPTWGRLANEQDGLTTLVQDNLIRLCEAMDDIRDHFNRSINVHCTFRPLKYNKEIGGSLNSGHLTGQAMDFHVTGITCAQVQENLLKSGLLEKLNLRMENNGPKATWVHIDTKPVLKERYFKP